MIFILLIYQVLFIERTFLKTSLPKSNQFIIVASICTLHLFYFLFAILLVMLHNLIFFILSNYSDLKYLLNLNDYFDWFNYFIFKIL